MKTYNKSKIMKEAHRLMRVEGLSRSVALTLAWDKARRSEFYWNLPTRAKRVRANRTISPLMENSLINFYSSNAYQGD